MELSSSRVMHEKVMEVAKNRRPTTTFVIKDRERNVLIDSLRILKIWV